MPPPQNPQFAPRKTRKGKAKSLKAEVTVQGPSPSHTPSPPPSSPAAPPPPPPPRYVFFPTYPSPSSTSSTPLPPPSMPKKRFLRRVLPIILATNLAVGGYVLLSTPKKPLSEKDDVLGMEVSSTPVGHIGTAIPEKTAH